ncbi:MULTISPECIES: hypothetical protein [unclassified Bradyrhizobium]|uniref:hypothetical protein n=1 Tax=unclassified Bradyrhizobium TaxID=2631580 RepID=UPI0028EF81CA|nr:MULTISPECIES: hypothetical protein [unclassified Bradyrhizobium]
MPKKSVLKRRAAKASKRTSMPPSKTRNATKFEGAIGWSVLDDIKTVTRAILRPGEMAIEFSYDLSVFTGVLRLDNSNRYVGNLERVWNRTEHATVHASCRMFERDDERLFFGTWTEEGTNYRFWINLDPSED